MAKEMPEGSTNRLAPPALDRNGHGAKAPGQPRVMRWDRKLKRLVLVRRPGPTGPDGDSKP